MPKIIGASLEEHRERTREKIFAALGELLGTHEFDEITFSSIAKSAGVGRTAMYNHFPDKDTLLVEYAIHETDGYIRALEEGISHARSPREAVLLYVRTQLELTVSLHMPTNLSRHQLAPQTAMKMHEHVLMIDKVLRRILDSGIASGDFAEDLDVDAAIRIINALVVGKRMQRVTRSSLEEFVLRGLGAQV
ncbi:TetR/AcrR family transcriptional regulator [Brachybacterium timonense]|uniref:TetR/AcrR family transcriptional regulator n=1 Tax=Brachybacterium timonense TaxID=2050896 RepID=UPI000D0B731D|nr:TetR/AcrR family transcriptional regulator [Brachybacterium timonense]